MERAGASVSVVSDPERLREAFRDPALGWIVERLRRRLAEGRPLRGTMALRAPSDAERAAVERLLGHPPSRGPARRQALTLRLEELEEILRHVELADGLVEAVEALTGPVVDRRAERQRPPGRRSECCSTS